MTTYLSVWGDLACFTRPEMKVERVSYPVITPSAARGLLEAILYRPQFRWHVTRIAICRPIRFLGIRRNEVKSRLTRDGAPLLIESDRTQRNTLALRDVEYVVEAEIRLTSLANLPRQRPPAEERDQGPDTVAKYHAMFERRARQGQCFAQPYFGCREFPANFTLAEPASMARPGAPAEPDADLGLMVYDVFDLDPQPPWRPGRSEASPRVSLFRAAISNGCLVERQSDRLPDWSEIKRTMEAAR